jgi:hypothetical protein
VAATTGAASVSGKSVFSTRVMARVASIAAPVASFVSVEVVETFLPAARHRPMVAVMRVKTVVDVAVEAVRTVEPGSGSEKHPAVKPIGAIVAVGRTVIRSIVEVAIGADGFYSNADADLGRPHGRTAEQRNRES